MEFESKHLKGGRQTFINTMKIDSKEEEFMKWKTLYSEEEWNLKFTVKESWIWIQRVIGCFQVIVNL